MAHTCHATGCMVPVPPQLFMCRRHWFMLPHAMRNRIWSTYREGQEGDWKPSAAYCDAAKQAVTWLAEKEGVEPDVRIYDLFAPQEGE